jgi:predicted transcriptional regulator
MVDTATMTIRLSREVRDELDRLAASTGRSRSLLAAEAIASYLALQRWQVAGIEAAIAEADAGAPAIGQDDIEAWLRSWGIDRQLPPPLGTSEATFPRGDSL